MTRLPVPKVYVTRFFQLVTTRQFAEGERVLQRLKQKMHVSERNRGYFQALNGILLAQKNNDDKYAFLPNLNLNNKKELQNYRREFLRQSESHLHAEYDKGFLAAWAEYLNVLTKMELPTPTAPSASQVEKQTKEETKMETEIKAETRKESPDEKREKLEPRQSTLFDFSSNPIFK